jgi:hypothetical protein
MNACLEVLLLLLVAALLLVTAPIWLPLALEIGLALSFLWVPVVLLLAILWVIFLPGSYAAGRIRLAARAGLGAPV